MRGDIIRKEILKTQINVKDNLIGIIKVGI